MRLRAGRAGGCAGARAAAPPGAPRRPLAPRAARRRAAVAATALPDGQQDAGGTAVADGAPASSSAPAPSSSTSSSSSSSSPAPAAAPTQPAAPPSPGGPPYAAVALLAAAGAAETAYLAYAKLAAVAVACPVGGACGSVLDSPYAYLFGLPLPLFGAAAYAGVAGLAASCAADAAGGREPGGPRRAALAAGAAALAATSAYLMTVLFGPLGGAPCVWCFGSAGLSLTIAAALGLGLPPRQLADAAGPALGAVAATAAVLVAGYSPDAGTGGGRGAALQELAYAKPEVTAASSGRALALAARLRDAGATMKGAFWCSHWCGAHGGQSAWGAGIGMRLHAGCMAAAWPLHAGCMAAACAQSHPARAPADAPAPAARRTARPSPPRQL
jgi:uncharacterized membrane protein